MATKEKTRKQQLRIDHKEARKVVLDKFAAEFGLGRSWTRSGDFIALFLLKTFNFQMTSEYKGAHPKEQIDPRSSFAVSTSTATKSRATTISFHSLNRHTS